MFIGGRRKTSIPQWLKSITFRACIFGGFTILFLYLRLKLNKTPPIFSGELCGFLDL